jgi:ferric-chelate reductase
LDPGVTQLCFYRARRAAAENGELVDTVRVPVHVSIDGPYGGCCLDLGEYEDVLLVTGGAGATFILELLDDLCWEDCTTQARAW